MIIMSSNITIKSNQSGRKKHRPATTAILDTLIPMIILNGENQVPSFAGIALINIVYMFRQKPAEILGNYIKEKSERRHANVDEEDDDDDVGEVILKEQKRRLKK